MSTATSCRIQLFASAYWQATSQNFMNINEDHLVRVDLLTVCRMCSGEGGPFSEVIGNTCT